VELRYVPRAELERIRTLEGDRYERAAAFAGARAADRRLRDRGGGIGVRGLHRGRGWRANLVV